MTISTLFSTFSFAALLSLSLAGCAVDEPDTQARENAPISPEQAAQRIRDGLGLDQPKLPDVPPHVRAGLVVEPRKDSESDDEAAAYYCDENEQCESNICDQRQHACVR